MARQRYSYRLMVSVEEWAQVGALVLDRFHRSVLAESEAGGYPPPPGGTTPRIVGLRLNSEGARDDRGELMTRIECDPKDPRVIEIELRMSWIA